MGVVEGQHLGGAIIALVAGRDAFRIVLQGIDNPGDGACIAIGNRAAIGLVGIGGYQQRERDEAGKEIVQAACSSARTGENGPCG